MEYRKSILFLLGFVLIFHQRELRAQSIPLMIPHSGTVTVNGAPFNGNGLFKFAIVNKDCTLSPPGAGCATLWSNDGTPGAGVEPVQAVTLAVTNGLFTVKLGDTALTNMQTIPVGVFNTAETYLRIWFNDGATGSQLLSPDRQLVSVPYAYRAEIADSVAGANVSKSIIIPATAFTPSNSTLTYQKSVPSNGFTATTSGAGSFIASIPIPTGSTITGLELRAFDTINPGSVSAFIQRGQFLTTATVPNSTAQTIDAETGCTPCNKVSGTINETISSDVNTYYWIQVDISSASFSLGFYSVKITYTP